MSSGAKYSIKDRKVKIFQIYKRTQDDSTVTIVKEYKHPKEKYLNAHIKQLIAKEGFSSDSHQDASTYLVVINYRKGISVDCYVEFKDKVLKVIGADYYEDRNIEIKLTCQAVSDHFEIDEVIESE